MGVGGLSPILSLKVYEAFQDNLQPHPFLPVIVETHTHTHTHTRTHTHTHTHPRTHTHTHTHTKTQHTQIDTWAHTHRYTHRVFAEDVLTKLGDFSWINMDPSL